MKGCFMSKVYRYSGDGRNREISDYFSMSFVDLDPVTNARTQQHFRKECDINTIFAKYRVTGLVRVPSRARSPVFADVPSDTDLHSALNLTFKCQSNFGKLPADVRKRFDNDFTKYYSYLSDPSNLEDSYFTGIRSRPEVSPVPPSAPSPAPSPAAAPLGGEAPGAPLGAPSGAVVK